MEEGEANLGAGCAYVMTSFSAGDGSAARQTAGDGQGGEDHPVGADSWRVLEQRTENLISRAVSGFFEQQE